MPLYEYDCPKCGRFEVLQKMSEAPVEQHDCGSKVHKVMSASAFSFKGSGFYITDYKNKTGAKVDGGGDAKPADARPGTPEAKPATDAKPAATDSKPATPTPAPHGKTRSDSRKK